MSACAVLLLLLLSPPVASAGQPVVLVRRQAFLPEPPAMDPDAGDLRYFGLSGRWHGHVGGSFVLGGIHDEILDAAIGIETFLELANFSDDHPISFETVRASVGFTSLWHSSRLDAALLPKGGQLIASLAWIHESDHIPFLDEYIDRFVDPAREPVFEPDNMSAYEYFKLRLAWHQPLWADRLRLSTAPSVRVFTPSINPGDQRAMRWAPAAEVRLSVRATGHLWVSLGGYTENILHDFRPIPAGLIEGLGAETLHYRQAELALDISGSADGVFTPHLLFSNSDGRGIDFVESYGPEWGGGVRFTL